jgi:hypothetical protein
VLIGAAESQEGEVHEMREGAVDVTDVAVVDLSSRQGPRNVLEDPLVTA